MLPPIHYPLPTLVVLILLSCLTWKGAEWSRAWRASVADRLQRAALGPPVPNSKTPIIVAGPIHRRGLLLRDQTVVTDRPKGSTLETIERRMFVDVYDVWPDTGAISHVRVGNRRPLGWVEASAVLLWDTRLVIRPPTGRLSLSDRLDGQDAVEVEVGSTPVPILAWNGSQIEVATWESGRSWASVARRGWVDATSLPPEAWGCWISQVELPILLRQSLEADPSTVRLQAILGKLADRRSFTRADVEAAQLALPKQVTLRENPDPKAVLDRLAEANAHPRTDASWSGLSFHFLPMIDLP